MWTYQTCRESATTSDDPKLATAPEATIFAKILDASNAPRIRSETYVGMLEIAAVTNFDVVLRNFDGWCGKPWENGGLMGKP